LSGTARLMRNPSASFLSKFLAVGSYSLSGEYRQLGNVRGQVCVKF
jgi:hypothetical protein